MKYQISCTPDTLQPMSMDPKLVVKRWRKEPKKFLERLIDDVWNIPDSGIFLVNFSGYFKKVLWPYFHPDSSSTKHILLIAKYAVYDSTVEDPIVSEGSIQHMTLSEKFPSFFKRLVAVATDKLTSLTQNSVSSNETANYDLAPIYDLLAHFVSNCLHIEPVKQSILKLLGLTIWNWIPNLSDILDTAPSYIKLQFERLEPISLLKEKPFIILLLGATENDSTAALLFHEYHSINTFLITCLQHSALRSRLNLVVKALGYLSLVPKTVPNRESLKYNIYYPVDDFTGEYLSDHENTRATKFFEFQTKLYDIPEAQSLVLVPSIYDTLQGEVETILGSIKSLQKLRLILDLNLERERLVVEIADYLFTPLYDLKELLDVRPHFNDVSVFSKPDLPSTSGNYLSKSHFLETQSSEIKSKWICESMDHIRLVLDRKFVSKRSSKYISRISYNEGNDPLTVSPSDKTFSSPDTITLGSHVLLLQIILPEKHTPIELTRLYGVYSMMVTTVESWNPKSKTLKLSEGHSKYTYILRLPPLKLDLIQFMKREVDLPKSIEDILLLNRYEEESLELSKEEITINSGDSKPPDEYVLGSVPKEIKKMKLEEGVDIPRPSGEQLVVHLTNKTYYQDIVSDKHWSTVDGHGILSCLTKNITTIKTGPHSEWLGCVIDNLMMNFPSERILLVAPNPPVLSTTKSVTLEKDVGLKLEALRREHDICFKYISELIDYLELPELDVHLKSSANLLSTLKVYVEPLWIQFLEKYKESPRVDTIQMFPFQKLDKGDFKSPESGLTEARRIYIQIKLKYDDLRRLAPVIKFANNPKESEKYLIANFSSIVGVSNEWLMNHINSNPTKELFHFDTIILSDAHFMSELESVLPFYISNPKRIIVLGSEAINQRSLFHRISMIENGKRLYGVGQKKVQENNQRFNSGFEKTSQNISVLQSKATSSHNIAEAEYIVSVYMYMRCIGYASKDIDMVVLGPVQKMLIQEMVEKKCGGSSWYKIPKVESISETYGVTNNYILLSTHGVSGVAQRCHIARAALSAQLGMYVFGNFLEKGSKLKIRVGESYGESQRSKQSFLIEDEQHMADYVTQLEIRRK